MIRAGILYILDNKIYLNGRYISDSADHFYNLVCINTIHLPNEILMFNQDSKNSHEIANSILQRLPKEKKVIRYKQRAPWIYYLVNFKHYYRAIVVGICLGIIQTGISLKKGQDIMGRIEQDIKRSAEQQLNVDNILSQFSAVCDIAPCIERIMMSKSAFIVQLSKINRITVSNQFDGWTCEDIKKNILCQKKK